MQTIHFGEKYKEELMNGFRGKSYTESSFSHDLDMQFSGARTVHVLSLKTESLQDYDRSADVGAGSRFGKTKEVGDYEQTFTMTQDKSLSLSVDKGNNVEQFNMKKAGAIMAAERDEQIVPELDRYRLRKWAENAGLHVALSAEPTKTTIVSQIVELHNEMMDLDVSEDGCTLFVKRRYMPAIKLSPEWTGLDSLGGKSLPSGSVGMLDGLAVKPIASARFPANCYFMILHKRSVIAPMKINTFKGHTDPPGLSGDLLEFRMMHDAFVLERLCNGVGVACAPNTVCEAPTITVNGNSATLSSATENATIYYTLNGSDPRYSKDALPYTTAITVTSGDQLRTYAAKTGMFNSSVASQDIE